MPFQKSGKRRRSNRAKAMRRGIPFLLLAAAVLLFGGLAGSCLAQTKAPPVYPPEGMLLKGRVTNSAGEPLSDVLIRVIPSGDPSLAQTVKSDAKGAFSLVRVIHKGEVTVQFSHENCNTVARKFPKPEDFSRLDKLDIILACSERIPPLKEHAKHPGVSNEHYVGKYEVTAIQKGVKSPAYLLQLSGRHQSEDGKCRCGDAWYLALSCSSDPCIAMGCWQVKDHVAVAIQFPCGLAFAGGCYTLWEEGDGLVGQERDWTDTGDGEWCDVSMKRHS